MNWEWLESCNLDQTRWYWGVTGLVSGLTLGLLIGVWFG